MITHGSELRSRFSASVDVVIIGSGSGGAVAADMLSRAGHSVLVLEEGPSIPQSVYSTMSPSTSVRTIARESGIAAAVAIGDTPFISTLSGKCVGGSSLLTGGVCFRIPNDILAHWSGTLGLSEMTEASLDSPFSQAEERIHVEDVPASMRSRSTELFVEGAESMGIHMKSVRRNTKGCRGASRCTFGCPNGAKMSVDLSYLPQAMQNGTEILSDALVERITIAGGRARGVTGRLIHSETGKPTIPFEIRAKTVIIACGSMHTPGLLRDSGLSSKHIGRHLTLHPSFRVSAIFDEVVDGWDGAMQSVYSDDLHHEGITFVSVYSAVNVLAAAFPGVGKPHLALLHKTRNLAVFGGMIHDDGGGTIRRIPFLREPLLTYEMIERDRKRLFRGIQLVGEMAFAAGAKQVLLPLFGSEPFNRKEDLEFLSSRPPRARSLECLAFHPLGSAKMSRDRQHGVVKPTGETWDVDGLYVFDGSILPTSIGVNSQLPIMGVVTMLAERLADELSSRS